MIIYNVTIKVDLSVEEEWLQWMKVVHIPEVMKTGCFTSNQMFRLMEEEQSDGVTYAVQYACRNLQDLNTYQKEFAPALQREHNQKYKDRFVAFRTLLEKV